VHLNYRLVEKLITTRKNQHQPPKFWGFFFKLKITQNHWVAVAGTWHRFEKAWTTITKKLKSHKNNGGRF